MISSVNPPSFDPLPTSPPPLLVPHIKVSVSPSHRGYLECESLKEEDEGISRGGDITMMGGMGWDITMVSGMGWDHDDLGSSKV